MKPISLLFSAVLLAQFVIGCKPAGTGTPATPLPTASVNLVQPKRGDILRNLTLPGNVVANQQTILFAKVTGYLKTITVDKGDTIKAGELIAEIEAPELLAEVAKAKAEWEHSELELKRAMEAQKKAPDLVVMQVLDSARSTVAIAKANFERAQTLVGFCKITAPFGGTITKRFADPGSLIPSATANAATQTAALVTLVDMGIVRVQVFVPEPEVPLVKKGQPVKLSVEGYPGKTITGTVTRISQALDESTRTMLAEIDLENSSGELRPGMFATVKIGVEKHSDTTLLPVETVLAEKSGTSVFTVEGGKAKKVAVKTGFNDGVNVEVLQGINPAESVVLIGKLTLANGQPLKVLEAK